MADTPSAPSAPSTPAAANAAATSDAASAPAEAPRAGRRALATLAPATPRRGEPFEVRTLVAHPMETGHRVNALGQRFARDIVRRVEARLDGELVFASDLHPAIAANPYVAFPLLARADGTLTVTWAGDRGFAHTVSVPVKLA